MKKSIIPKTTGQILENFEDMDDSTEHLVNDSNNLIERNQGVLKNIWGNTYHLKPITMQTVCL